MSAYTLTDGSQVVSFYPEWDLKMDDRKIATTNRSRYGTRYDYIFGSYKRCEFSVQFVSSSDRCIINSWWNANTNLSLTDWASSVVCSGRLVNPTAPIDQYIQPYTDQFMGSIQLESSTT